MAGGKLRSFRNVVLRKRVFEPEQLETGNLRRCLTRWDLTALGVGSTLGVGVYVLVGSVALNIAGPSIVLSFLIAAVASLFAGLCYAEFGSRVPRAGSAYIYTYVTVGELAAFIIGWNIILESLFGTASVARGLSIYVDSITGKAMSGWLLSVVPMSSTYLSSYFDFFSFGVVIVLGVLLAFGVRESSMVNNAFAVINMIIILFIIVVGAFTADVKNWNIPVSEVPANFGSGGFFPYGVWGTLRGAAICFYGFVGFDSISSTGEEVREPRRAIPHAILIVLAIVFVSYAGVATVVTMMVPYYLQDKVASVATAFTYVGWDWARWIVSIGAIFGICASLFGAMFPLPRLLYAMASDGLLFRGLSRISTSRKSPIIATLLPTIIIAILSALLELEQLVMMMCIGTLLSYTIVAACVIMLRYRSNQLSVTSVGYLKQIFGFGEQSPTQVTKRIVDVALSLFICTCLAMAFVWIYVRNTILTVVLHAAALLLLLVIALQPKAVQELSFKTPLVPIIPCLSIYVNINLMVYINIQTWIRVIIWILIGIPVYIICVCCNKRKKSAINNNNGALPHTAINGKTPVQIIVESPTPPDTIKRSSNNIESYDTRDTNSTADDDKIEIADEIKENTKENIVVDIKEEMVVQYAILDDNEEKEAKIIDLLDKVLQAEEDTFGEIISLKDQDEITVVSTSPETIPHRKSLSELSDAGSDASLGNLVLSKYDVIAQVHREDLPKLQEEEEKIENRDTEEFEEENIDESESNSRTDESGYSDTIDRTVLNESMEELGEEISSDSEEKTNIPKPPPLDENYFASPSFKKSYTVSARSYKSKAVDEEEVKPRLSIKSNASQDDGHIVFGSDRQMNFMSKLNNIFQNKMSSDTGEEKKKSRSTDSTISENTISRINARPLLLPALQKEILSREASQNLRPVNIDHKHQEESQNDEDVETSMSREDLKSKLENIFAAGGPILLKPRLMKSNPPTPEESYQTDSSSNESLAKLPKVEKGDTLSRQKAKFGAVLNSIRLSFNKDDHV